MFDPQAPPEDPVAGARALLDALAFEDRSGWGPSARRERVLALAGLKERVDAALVDAAGGCDAAGDWALDGASSMVSWLAQRAPITDTEASQVVADARFARAHDDIAAAVAMGAITASHLRILRRKTKGLDEAFAACKDTLLGQALCENPTEFAETMKQWRNLLHEREPQHGDRGFRIRHTLGGWGVPDGLLDPELCALFDRCLKDLNPPDTDPGPEGPRTAYQRGADTLGELFRRYLRGDDGAAPATTADVVVDLPVLARRRFADVLDPADRYPAPWNRSSIDGRPLPVADAERLLCDSPFGRIVLDELGEVLDLGRQRRTYNRAQRRAMATRDGGCAWLGCDRPPEWCHAHHTQFWERDQGHTDLDLGVLLCARHHTLVHKCGWTLHRDPESGLITLTAPDGHPQTYDTRTQRRRPPRPQPDPGLDPHHGLSPPSRC